MPGEYGVENVKKALSTLVEVGNVADYIGAHPELGIGKWSKLSDLADELIGITSINFENLKKEFMEMDEADREDVKKHISEKFNLVNDKLEEQIEEAFGLAIEAYELTLKIMAFSKTLK